MDYGMEPESCIGIYIFWEMIENRFNHHPFSS